MAVFSSGGAGWRRGLRRELNTVALQEAPQRLSVDDEFESDCLIAPDAERVDAHDVATLVDGRAAAHPRRNLGIDRQRRSSGGLNLAAGHGADLKLGCWMRLESTMVSSFTLPGNRQR
jgi:hypothetical protein